MNSGIRAVANITSLDYNARSGTKFHLTLEAQPQNFNLETVVDHVAGARTRAGVVFDVWTSGCLLGCPNCRRGRIDS